MIDIYERENHSKSIKYFKKLDIQEPYTILKIIYEDINEFGGNRYIKLWYHDFILSLVN